MNYEILIAIILGMPEEELIGYYDEEDCQCCYDYVSHTDPETILMTLEEAGFDWQNLRREHTSMLLPFFCRGKHSAGERRFHHFQGVGRKEN